MKYEPAITHDTFRYLVVLSKPHRTLELAEDTAALDDGLYDVFCPTITKQRRTGRTRKRISVIQPLFSPYMFVGMMGGPSPLITALKQHDAFWRVLMVNDSILWVPTRQIEALKAIDWDRVTATPGPEPYKVGTPLVIINGPFSGMGARYLGNGSAAVMIFGQETKVTLPNDWFRAVKENA